MDALSALHNRVSIPRVTGPVPTPEQQEALFRAALRAPDHGRLRPWRFLTVEGEGLVRLGELFTAAELAKTGDPEAASVLRAPKLAQRSPLVIIAIACPQAHPKVPEHEQDMSCAVAVGNMLVAAHAMGLGAVWRTGEPAVDPIVKKGLGLAEHEKIIAYLYVGQPTGPSRPVPELDPADFIQRWPAD